MSYRLLRIGASAVLIDITALLVHEGPPDNDTKQDDAAGVAPVQPTVDSNAIPQLAVSNRHTRFTRLPDPLRNQVAAPAAAVMTGTVR